MLFVINNEDDETLDVIFFSDELYSLLQKKGYDNDNFIKLYQEDGQHGINELLLNIGVSIINIKDNLDINENIPKIYFDQFISTLKQKHENVASIFQDSYSSESEF